jgi:hypothetical protein
MGAAAFWGPVAVYDLAVRGDIHPIIVTMIALVCPLIAYWWLSRSRLQGLRALPLYMLLGIYLLGPLAFMLTMTALGGGFATAGSSTLDDVKMTIEMTVFPLAYLEIATYSATLGAWFLITFIFGWLGVARLGNPQVQQRHE